MCWGSLYQEVMLWISRLPAFVIIEGPLALGVALWSDTLPSHVPGDILDFLVQLLDMRLNFLQVHLSFVVDHLSLMENTVHVAFQFFVFVNFAVAEFFDGLYKRSAPRID